jgi:hypothetical protein
VDLATTRPLSLLHIEGGQALPAQGRAGVQGRVHAKGLGENKGTGQGLSSVGTTGAARVGAQQTTHKAEPLTGQEQRHRRAPEKRPSVPASVASRPARHACVPDISAGTIRVPAMS